MYKQLVAFSDKPAAFSAYTVRTLWTDPHIAGQMLAHHLNPAHDIASRNPAAIRSVTQWIDKRLGVAGQRLCDLGCGPGLYAAEFAQFGAQVTGCDFSESSLAYARSAAGQAGHDIVYSQTDYLADPLPEDQDVIVLIYGDICALSPAQRQHLLSKVYRALRPGGTFILDAFPQAHFEAREEMVQFSRRLMDGFWSAVDYFGFQQTFLYPGTCLALDRYLIVEAHRSFEVFNWLQYFQPQDLAGEVMAAGFEVEDPVDAVTGLAWTDPERMFALVARK